MITRISGTKELSIYSVSWRSSATLIFDPMEKPMTVINGDRYMEAPGQWICKLGALPRILRVHSKAQALELMEYFQDHGFLTFEILDEEKEILRFTIADWKEHCTHLQYNYYSYASKHLV